MDEKDINLLPEDLRKKKIKLPKLNIEKDFDFELSQPDKLKKFKKEEARIDKPQEVKGSEKEAEKIEKKISPPVSFPKTKIKEPPIEFSKGDEGRQNGRIKEEKFGKPMTKKDKDEDIEEEKKKEKIIFPAASSKKTKIKEPPIEFSKGDEGRQEKQDKEEKKERKILTISKIKLDIFSRMKDFLAFQFKKIFDLRKFLNLKKEENKKSFYVDVNLILGEEKFLKSKEKKIFKKLYFEIAVCLAIILFSYFYLAVVQWEIGHKDKKIKGDILKIDNQIAAFKSRRKDLIELQKKVLQIQDLLKKHIYWTNFFALLEKYTLPDVYYMDFAASSDQPLDLKGVAKNSQSLVKQIISFKNASDFIEKLEIKDIELDSSETGKILFAVTLFLKPEIFLK